MVLLNGLRPRLCPARVFLRIRVLPSTPFSQRALSTPASDGPSHTPPTPSAAVSGDLLHNSTKAPTPDFFKILSRPTWSVRSLLPPEPPSSTPESSSTSSPTTSQESDGDDGIITPSQLHHLLRLSALPLPSSREEEAEMIRTLQAQLHFVRAIQAVDTAGVPPLRSIRDETAAGRREETIGLEQLQGELALEGPFGRSRRPRRRKEVAAAAAAAAAAASHPTAVEPWDALQTAPRRAGRYFVVKSPEESS